MAIPIKYLTFISRKHIIWAAASASNLLGSKLRVKKLANVAITDLLWTQEPEAYELHP